MKWCSESAYGRSTKFSTWNSIRQLTAYQIREHVSPTKECFRVRCSSSENARDSESRSIDKWDHTFARKPEIAYRSGLVDTNGEIFVEFEGEKIRFYAPRTNTRVERYNKIKERYHRSLRRIQWWAVCAASRRAFPVKRVRTDASYFRKDRRSELFYLDHVSPQRKYTFNRKNTRAVVEERFPSGPWYPAASFCCPLVSFRAPTSTSTVGLHGPRRGYHMTRWSLCVLSTTVYSPVLPLYTANLISPISTALRRPHDAIYTGRPAPSPPILTSIHTYTLGGLPFVPVAAAAPG